MHNPESELQREMNGTIKMENTGSIRETRSKSKWWLFVIVLLLAFGGAGYATIYPNQIKSLLARFFGPPKVQLQESFSEKPDGPTFDHSAWNELLKLNVDDDGWVDYQNLTGNPGQLDSYIKRVETTDIESLGRNERLAFLINAYNAFTLKLITENYPLESIKEIPDAERWDAVRWNLAGEIVSLNQIEQEYIRPNFKEPRIHFALVCAAIGCPPLRNEAYTGANLEKQLAGQATYVHSHSTWFRLDQDGGRLELTQLYNWYGDDFVQVAGSVLKFAADYSDDLKRKLGQGNEPAIDWLDYDWTLNGRLKKTAR